MDKFVGLTLPDSVTAIAAADSHTSPFYYYSNLTSLSSAKIVTVVDLAFANTSLKTVSLPAATTLGAEVFDNCLLLTTIDLPLVTSIGNKAFWYCTSITRLNMGTTPPTMSGIYWFPTGAASNITVHVPTGTDITTTGAGTWATWITTYLNGATLAADL
jgi:hypothetical protein